MSSFYIIGNGFDLHHNMKTDYKHYKEFLVNNYINICNDYEKCNYLHLNSNTNIWSDVEKELKLTCDDCLESKSDLYPNISDELTPGWNNIEIALESELKFFKPFVVDCFNEWISQINISDTRLFPEINNENYYLSFNYTETLEKLYNILGNRILHIHGKCGEELVFGCPYNNEEEIYEALVREYNDDEWYSLVYEPAIIKIYNCYKVASKKLKNQYLVLSKFIKNMKQRECLESVIVMGHSFNGVDMPYYEDIIIPLLKNENWVFYAYGKTNEELDQTEKRIRKFTEENGIYRFNIQEW
ncbi:MAG: bacteriophage abortive infection AbiH family protein [Clostridiales bacterium]|nr:bacteriophage abortive infection AbiH family protein [Clostridiales bacterium]